jgi:hypothetical protein
MSEGDSNGDAGIATIARGYQKFSIVGGIKRKVDFHASPAGEVLHENWLRRGLPSAPNPKFAHIVRQMRSRTSGSKGALES